MAPFVTAEDVKSRWLLASPIPVNDQALNVLIEDAEDVIAQALPQIDSWIANGDLPVERYRRVAARIIIRQLKNPEGVRTRQETQGPFSGMTTMAGDNPGELYLTDADRIELMPDSVKLSRGGAFTIIPSGGGRYG